MISVVNLHRMEACGGDLKEKLLKLFEILFLLPRVRIILETALNVKENAVHPLPPPQDREFDIDQVIKKLMRHFNTLNQDYGEFLALKGSFNIPIVRYPQCLNGRERAKLPQ